MSKLKIGMLLDNEYNGDLRVINEAESLVKNGFEVFILCFNHGQLKNQEVINGVNIKRFFFPKLFKNKLRPIVLILPLYYWVWQFQIKKLIQENKIDVLHAHDLYMLPPALKIKERLSRQTPVVGDLHENYVEALKHYRFANTFPGNLLISIKKWTKKEIMLTKKTDYLITVIEEAVGRYTSLGVNKEKIFVIPNYVNFSSFDSKSTDYEQIKDKFKGSYVISYIGGFDLHRGLESVVRALPGISKQIRNLKFMLVGTGSNKDDLLELAKELNVEDHISFEGWQPPSKLPSYVRVSNICLIPHLKTVHTDNTIPHKLFQYMYYEKPVVASNCRPIERILTDSNAGVIFESNNSKSLAEKIINLYRNPDYVHELGKNGKSAVLEYYNWKTSEKSLENLYYKILDEKI